MLASLHLLRPWWLLLLFPVLALLWKSLRQPAEMGSWKEECDAHLLENLLQIQGKNTKPYAIVSLFFSLFFMIIALTGPAWEKLPVPAYQMASPHVILLDMSNSMLDTDLSPDRLSRAKFKLHDLFMQKGKGQFALIAYTSEPFVVSPLTDDGTTIDALLPMLSPDIMPVQGKDLSLALKEADKLLKNAGFHQGNILVMTDSTPNDEAINLARELSQKNRDTSIMPVLKDGADNPLYQKFADAGQGKVINLATDSSVLNRWLNQNPLQHQYKLNQDNDIPLWKDRGRWFLIPALLLLIPVFRRGWLQRIML